MLRLGSSHPQSLIQTLAKEAPQQPEEAGKEIINPVLQRGRQTQEGFKRLVQNHCLRKD